MDSFASNFHKPISKTSIQYQPLHTYCIHHTGTGPPEQQKSLRVKNKPKHFTQAVHYFSASMKGRQGNYFSHLSDSIRKMSISHQIWYNTFPVGTFYNPDTDEWMISVYFIYFLNFIVFATCLVLYTMQILYFQDLKICRDFDYRFKPLPMDQNLTFCSFLNQCSLRTPIANQWRLQEYAWLRIALSTVQFLPFLLLFFYDWVSIRQSIQTMDRNIRHYAEHEDESKFIFIPLEANTVLNLFKILVFFCCFIVGVVLFILDYEAHIASKDCLYNMQNGKREPENWAFFLPDQKAPSTLPLVFLIFGSFFTFWSFNFLIFSFYRGWSKLIDKGKEGHRKLHLDLQNMKQQLSDDNDGAHGEGG